MHLSRTAIGLWPLALCLSYCAAGCGGTGPVATPQPKAPKATPLPIDATLSRMVDQLGDESAVVLVVDSRQWKDLLAWSRAHPVVAQSFLGSAQSYGTLRDALTHIAKNGPRSAEMEAAPFAALDERRPIVVGMLAGILEGPPGSSAAMAPLGSTTVPGIRHEILLPATDAAKLASSLAKGLDLIGQRVGDYWTVEGTFVGLRADGDVVRLGILANHFRPLSAAEESPPIWPARRTVPTRTPAYVNLTRGGQFLTVLVRPWRFRAAAIIAGLEAAISASRSAAPDIRAALQAIGVATVLSADPLLAAARPEFDDHSFALRPSVRGVTIDGVSSLTPAGAESFAPLVSQHIRFPVKVPHDGELLIGLDLAGALASTPPRAETVIRGGASDQVVAVRDCGVTCIAHGFLRVPLGTFKALTSEEQARLSAVLALLPKSIQAVSLPAEPDQLPPFAIVAQVSPTFSLEKLREQHPLVSLVESGGMIEADVDDVGGRRLLLIGAGVEPEDVFELSKSSPSRELMAMKINETFFRRTEAMAKFKLTNASHLKGGDWRMSLGAEARQLYWRAELVLGEGPVLAPPDPVSVSWSAPMLGYAAGAADGALATALAKARQAFVVMASGSKEMAMKSLVKAIESMEPDLEKAERQASTRDAAVGLRRQLVDLALTYSDARPIVEAQCAKTKDPWICKRLEAP